MPKGEIDLNLEWDRAPGADGKVPERPHLDRGNLYLLACREAFRTRVPDQRTQAFLERFRQGLKVPSKEARRFMIRAREDRDADRLEPAEAFDPDEVFRKACHFAQVTGTPDSQSRVLLAALARALHIEERGTQSTLYMRAIQVEALPGDASPAPPEDPAPPPEPAPTPPSVPPELPGAAIALSLSDSQISPVKVSSENILTEGDLLTEEAHNLERAARERRLMAGGGVVTLGVVFFMLPAHQRLNLLKMLLVLAAVVGAAMLRQSLRGEGPGGP